MSFHVEPTDLRRLAIDLQQAYADTADTKTYVQAYGTFSFHETGIIGALSGAHAEWMGELEEMFNHLLVLTDSASRSLQEIATTYEETDAAAAARIDAGYPVAPRPPVNRD